MQHTWCRLRSMKSARRETAIVRTGNVALRWMQFLRSQACSMHDRALYLELTDNTAQTFLKIVSLFVAQINHRISSYTQNDCSQPLYPNYLSNILSLYGKLQRSWTLLHLLTWQALRQNVYREVGYLTDRDK